MAHILLLLLALLLESYLRLQHRRRQAAGYLAFYWRTRSLLPLATRTTALGQVSCQKSPLPRNETQLLCHLWQLHHAKPMVQLALRHNEAFLQLPSHMAVNSVP